jgi:hypothetical protein
MNFSTFSVAPSILVDNYFNDIGDDISINSSNVKININNVCNLINHTKRVIQLRN